MTSVSVANLGNEDKIPKQVEKESDEDDGSTKYIVMGVLAFCGLMGITHYWFDHSDHGQCIESDANVCCMGVNHPLII